MNIEVGKVVSVKRKPTNENSATIVRRIIKEVNYKDKTIDCDDNIRYSFSDIVYEAKSGKIYLNIPDELDVDTWDNMSIIERLHYKGLIKEK